MTTPRLYPPALSRDPLARKVRSLFALDFREGSLNALTGQVGTLARASTGTVVDHRGVSVTIPRDLPQWEARDLNGDTVRESLGLRLAGDDLTYPLTFGMDAAGMSLLVEGVETGTRTVVGGAGLMYLGNNGQTGARLLIASNATNYLGTWHDGTTAATSTLTGATPATNARFWLRLTVTAAGVATVARSLDGVTETVATASGAVALVSAFGAGAVIRFNRLGSAGTLGNTWLRRVRVVPGVRSLAELRAIV